MNKRNTIVEVAAAAFLAATSTLIALYYPTHSLCAKSEIISEARDRLCIWLAKDNNNDKQLVSELTDGCNLIIEKVRYPELQSNEVNQIEQLKDMWVDFFKKMPIKLSSIINIISDEPKSICEGIFSFQIVNPYSDKPDRHIEFVKAYQVTIGQYKHPIIEWREK